MILSPSFHSLAKERLAQWPLLCPQYNKKSVQIMSLAAKARRLTTTINIPDTQNPLAKTFFVMLNSKNEWQGLFWVVVNEEWNSFFLYLEIFLKVFLIILCFHCDCTRKEAKSHSIIVITLFSIKVSFTFLINFIFFFNWRNRQCCIPNWSTHSPKKVTLRISKLMKMKIITLLFMKAFKHFTHSCCILFSTFPSFSQASLKCLSKIFIPSSPNSWIQLWNNQKTVSLQMSHNYGYKLSKFLGIKLYEYLRWRRQYTYMYFDAHKLQKWMVFTVRIMNICH